MLCQNLTFPLDAWLRLYIFIHLVCMQSFHGFIHVNLQYLFFKELWKLLFLCLSVCLHGRQDSGFHGGHVVQEPLLDFINLKTSFLRDCSPKSAPLCVLFNHNKISFLSIFLGVLGSFIRGHSNVPKQQKILAPLAVSCGCPLWLSRNGLNNPLTTPT